MKNNIIYRIYTEKKEGFRVSSDGIKKDIYAVLSIPLAEVREFLRYDVTNIDSKDLEKAKTIVFSEPQVDMLYQEKLPDLKDYTVFAVEFLPGQYDQRADSCEQCVQLLVQKEKPIVKCARVFAIKSSKLTDTDLQRIKAYLVNPVEMRLANLDKPKFLIEEHQKPAMPPVILGFKNYSSEQIKDFHSKVGFAMTVQDLEFVRDYFKKEERDPTETELKMLDTYWSDHCRHTTFLTKLNSVAFETDKKHPVQEAYKAYIKTHKEIYKGRKDKYPCFMDIGTIVAKKLKKQGILLNLDESEEINACSIKVKATVDGQSEDWLIMFKNETHNHPTEIEPYGGAATCLGGAIRDPLSGRSFVYQAMRVTGAPDPNKSTKLTLKGKLPRRVVTRVAAKGFSSYGNQIGLCTGMVKEFYHEGYEAKRLETGFVIGAAPAKNVVREVPKAGDVVLLVGGETGRDGCGGAVGSSKSHTEESLNSCGAEVQKGNPLTERKIQRLFRNAECTTLIKRCNDFGAGGVCVAVGEIADGIDINLNAVPKKYDGLSATELAISESQERMAVVVAPENVDKFIALAANENVNAVRIATVTSNSAMRMYYDNELVAELKRDMLNAAGVRQTVNAKIKEDKVNLADLTDSKTLSFVVANDFKGALLHNLSELHSCSQKGLVEHFDSSIGAGSVLVPLGGNSLLTPSQVMAALLPVDGQTDTASVCSYGFDPELSSVSPYLGAVYAVVESIVKLVSSGADPSKIYLTFQEYFKRLKSDPARWGTPLASLLGAYTAQMALGSAAIGGKDSMSGSFEELDVPPTLISFAVSYLPANNIITNVFTKGQKVYRIGLKRDKFSMPDFSYLNKLTKVLHNQILAKNVTAATVVERGGATAVTLKSCIGNGLGFHFVGLNKELFAPYFGDIVLSLNDKTAFKGFDIELLGETTTEGIVTVANDKIELGELIAAYTGTLEPIFPTKPPVQDVIVPVDSDKKFDITSVKNKPQIAKPKVIVPVFPGTNCEYDTAKKFLEAGAEVSTFVIKNRSTKDIEESCKELASLIKQSQILAFAGGFSGGDEPDGSGKFISSVFRNQRILDATKELFENKGGLILGICNGFQALVKLGLLPYGKIKSPEPTDATLTFNTIGRHIATTSTIKISSTLSPWLANCRVGEEYLIPISHGEGRFVCSDKELKELITNGQIATQYVNNNPNGSLYGIEGITDVTGRILGKMGHSERVGKHLYKNVLGNYDKKIFAAGVKYFE